MSMTITKGNVLITVNMLNMLSGSVHQVRRQAELRPEQARSSLIASQLLLDVAKRSLEKHEGALVISSRAYVMIKLSKGRDL